MNKKRYTFIDLTAVVLFGFVLSQMQCVWLLEKFERIVEREGGK